MLQEKEKNERKKLREETGLRKKQKETEKKETTLKKTRIEREKRSCIK